MATPDGGPVLLRGYRVNQDAMPRFNLNTLASQVEAVLGAGDGGPVLPEAIRPRPGQLAMALAVAHAIESDARLVVEAGTGLGKTYAYLVPALLSGRRVLLSTATQALQDQLFSRDIPVVSRSLGVPVRVAQLKGRHNYVCLQRLEQSIEGGALSRRDPAIARSLDQILHWARGSRSGDLSELSGLDEQSPLRSWITSTRENCLGHECPRLSSCHVYRARDAAQQADWVVINHHLLLSDLQLRAAGAEGLLPPTGLVVLDEAHQLKDLAPEALGLVVGSDTLAGFARDLATIGPRWARGMQSWSHLALSIERAAAAVGRLFWQAAAGGARVRWVQNGPEGLAIGGWRQEVAVVSQALALALVALQATEGAAPDVRHLFRRAQRVCRVWAVLTRLDVDGPDDATQVRWVVWTARTAEFARWQICQTPLHPAERLRHLFARDARAPRSWVLTSATLGGDPGLAWFARSMGLKASDGLVTLQLPSPFDHGSQAALYVPGDLPEPGQEAHAVALADAVARWAGLLGGRTLVLATSLRAVQRIAARLVEQLAASDHGLEVLVQGRLSKPMLLSKFRQAGEGTRGAVLVASASFWEGVDLPGAALQLLVIDKLPFPSPNDPLLAAQARQRESVGESGFETVFLPEAAQALRQGVGRLIRTQTDRGVVVIADRRLLTRSYGMALLGGLPPMERLADESQLLSALEDLALTRSSTRDRPSA